MWGKRFSIRKEWNAKYIYNRHVSLWWDFVSTKRRGYFSKETKVKSGRGINHIYSPLYSVWFAFLIHTDFTLLLLLACVVSACKPPEEAPLLWHLRVWLTKDTVLSKRYSCLMLRSPEKWKRRRRYRAFSGNETTGSVFLQLSAVTLEAWTSANPKT